MYDIKITYVLILKEFSKILSIIILFPYHHLCIILQCNFYCVNDNNVHNAYGEYYTGE